MTQQVHRSDPRILNRRTLQRDHRRLVQLLRPGMRVLDVGCGTGAITAGIARAVGPGGFVVGLDRDEGNLAVARQELGVTGNLTFKVGDLLAQDFETCFETPFDLATAARTLLWISQPDRALEHMKKVVRPGGRVVVLDYSLEDVQWEPEPPRAFQTFYRAFLDWRTANRWDNAIAKSLPALFAVAGLTGVEVHRCDEVVQRGAPDFFDAYASGIWLNVIQSVGPHLTASGFLDEKLRSSAEEQYARYVETALERQTQFAVTVEGQAADAR